MWNNIISITFKDEECTREWRQTFTKDFEGKYQQVCDVSLSLSLHEQLIHSVFNLDKEMVYEPFVYFVHVCC